MAISRRVFLKDSMRVLTAALGAPLVYSFVDCPLAFGQDSNLSQKEILNRFEWIRNNYKIGEELSVPDAEFVRRYATSENLTARGIGGNSSFYFTASTADAYAIAQGYAYHNGTGTYTYGADVSVTNQSGQTPQLMRFDVVCDSYGVGQNGATTFTGTHSCFHSVNYQNSFYANLQDAYSGWTVYWNLTLRLSGTSAGGNYFSGTY